MVDPSLGHARGRRPHASLNFLVPVGPDSYRWERTHATSGDEALSDQKVTIVRRAPSPAPTSPAADKTPTIKK
jgi:hypothetical protein